MQGWLGEGRAEEIADALEGDLVFWCHETTEHDDDGEHIPKDTDQHCAGAVIILEKLENPNQMMRISERLGGYDMRKMDMEANVFDDFDEFIEHHTN